MFDLKGAEFFSSILINFSYFYVSGIVSATFHHYGKSFTRTFCAYIFRSCSMTACDSSGLFIHAAFFDHAEANIASVSAFGLKGIRFIQR